MIASQSARHKWRFSWQGWELFLWPVAIVACPPNWPPWGQMWLLAVAIFAACKWLTWRRSASAAPLWRQVGYLVCWSGLDAETFLGSRRATSPDWGEWCFAVAKLLFGVGLIAFVVPLFGSEQLWLRGWWGMIGILFVLHFGLFHVLSCAWRWGGISAAPLMNWPCAARSLTDFWGARWNLAFRDLTHRYWFRPLVPVCGAKGALLLSFLMSGLVHELVVSWPAAAGYGGPTLYFVLQAIGILGERSYLTQRLGLNRGVPGRLYAAAFLLLPLGLLFPVPFVTRVIAPFLTALGV